ncbi:MAG: hypothetical protein ACLP7P_03370 [Rhodomicrobium sp.]
MDPDMVRQQEEAEREALALLLRKPLGAERKIAATVPQPAANAGGQGHEPMLRAIGAAPQHPAGGTGAPLSPVGLAPAPSLEAPAPLPQPMPHKRNSALARLGRFISFGLAGAVLGGGLGIAAEIYFQLLGDQAKLAVFGTAGLLAAFSAFASLLTSNSKVR